MMCLSTKANSERVFREKGRKKGKSVIDWENKSKVCEMKEMKKANQWYGMAQALQTIKLTTEYSTTIKI